ncbi:hypothetical protein ABH944_004865 [Caballeronia udeis]|uniref:Uncharacterized protein n=1 Tax=Caballeronia udeis TaxID=1232866 RepID=A0ABW8MPC1_9BURK
MSGYFGMGGDPNSAMGYAPPTGATADGSTPDDLMSGYTGGSAAGAGAPVNGMNQMMQMMLMQQAMQNASKIGQAPINTGMLAQATTPQASVMPAQAMPQPGGQQINPAMLGAMMNRGV